MCVKKEITALESFWGNSVIQSESESQLAVKFVRPLDVVIVHFNKSYKSLFYMVLTCM